MKFRLLVIWFVLSLTFSVSVFSTVQKEDEVLVVGNTKVELKELSGSGSYVNQKMLNTFKETDISKVLSYVPGVNFRPEEGHGLRPNISLRGTYSDRSSKITLMEDGLLISPAPYTSSAAYYFPSMGRMSGVEVLKGPSSIQYGPYTIGGAINLISTPIPEKKSGYILQEIGTDSLSKTHAHYGINDRHYGALIELYHHNHDGFESVSGYKNANTGFDIKDYHAKLRFNTDKNADIYNEFLLKIQRSTEQSNQTYVGLAEADFENNPRTRYGFTKYDVMDNQHQGLSLMYTLAWDDYRLQLTAYQHDFERDWFKVDKIDNQNLYGLGNGINTIISAANSGDINAQAILSGTNADAIEIKLKHNNREYESKGLDLKFTWENDLDFAKHYFVLGGRSTYDEEDRFQWYETSDWINGRLSELTEGSKPGFSSNNRITFTDAKALYVRNELKWEKFILTGGLRQETWKMSQKRFIDSDRTALNSEYPKELSNDTVTLLGLGLSYALTDSLQSFVGYHQGFTPTSGGADPEEADNIELGLRFNKGANSLTLIYFNSKYKNMFGECTNSGAATGDCELGDTFNAGLANIQGVELELSGNVSFSTVLFPWAIIYSYTDAVFESTFESDFWGNVVKGDSIPDIPAHQLTVTTGFVHESGYRGNIRLTYSGETCSLAACPQNSKIDANTMVDISLRKNIIDGLEGYLVVDNVFDATDIVARAPKNGIRTQKDRAFRTGLVYSF